MFVFVSLTDVSGVYARHEQARKLYEHLHRIPQGKYASVSSLLCTMYHYNVKCLL